MKSKIEESTDYSVDRLVFGTAVLDEETTVEEAGLVTESNIDALIDLEGGKRKRKKKVYSTPKQIKHIHKKRPKALLEYFSVEPSGKVKKLKQECEKCPVGTYMADHPDRYTCGRCGAMYYRTTADGKRMPIPKQNKPSVPMKGQAPLKAAPAKKKKK